MPVVERGSKNRTMNINEKSTLCVAWNVNCKTISLGYLQLLPMSSSVTQDLDYRPENNNGFCDCHCRRGRKVQWTRKPVLASDNSVTLVNVYHMLKTVPRI